MRTYIKKLIGDQVELQDGSIVPLSAVSNPIISIRFRSADNEPAPCAFCRKLTTRGRYCSANCENNPYGA